MKRSWLSRWREGASAPWRGLMFLNRHPRLWRYGLLPVFLNLLITGLVLLFLLGAAAGFAYYLHAQFPSGWWGIVLEALSGFGLLLAACGLAVVLWLLLQGILCSYSFEQLARQVELQLGTPSSDLREVPLRATVADSLRDAAALATVNLGFLFLHVIPAMGSMVALCGSFYFDCFTKLTFDLLSAMSPPSPPPLLRE